MNPIDLPGRSIADPVIQAYLDDQERADPVDFRLHAEFGFFGGPQSGFSLSSEPLGAFVAEHGAARTRHRTDDEEAIVTSVSFSGADAINAKQRAYAAALPFDLAFGDSAEDVAAKIGCEPVRRDASTTLPDTSAERFVLTFAAATVQVIARFDGDARLMGVALLPPARPKAAPTRRKGKASPAKIEKLRAGLPTARWREALAEGDEMFDAASIDQAEALLHGFIDRAMADPGDAAAVQAAVKELVLTLNAVNAASGMIETLERDEIGTLIDAVVRAAGVTVPDGEDITAEWREW